MHSYIENLDSYYMNVNINIDAWIINMDILHGYGHVAWVWAIHRLNLEWDFCPNGLNPKWTQPRMDSIPNGLNPEWTQPRNGLNPQWTQSRMDSTPNGLNPEGTQL
jgi:hypothetical protein